MTTSTIIQLANFVCSWWIELPHKSIAMVVCEDRAFLDAMWGQVGNEARRIRIGHTVERVREWKLELLSPAGIYCIPWINKHSADAIRGMHAERQLAILQGDPKWTFQAQEHLMSFPIEAMCMIVNKP